MHYGEQSHALTYTRTYPAEFVDVHELERIHHIRLQRHRNEILAFAKTQIMQPLAFEWLDQVLSVLMMTHVWYASVYVCDHALHGWSCMHMDAARHIMKHYIPCIAIQLCVCMYVCVPTFVVRYSMTAIWDTTDCARFISVFITSTLWSPLASSLITSGSGVSGSSVFMSSYDDLFVTDPTAYVHKVSLCMYTKERNYQQRTYE